MAISFDNATIFPGNGNPGTTVQTFSSYTMGSGVNALLLVYVYYAKGSPAQSNISSITFNGVSMTFGFYYPVGGSSETFQLYYLINPPPGAYDIVVTFDSNTTNYAVSAISYFGVDQTTPINTADFSFAFNNAATSLQDSFSIARNNDWALIHFWVFETDTWSATTGNLRVQGVVNPITTAVVALIDRAFSTAGSGDVTGATVNTDHLRAIGFTINPVAINGGFLAFM